MTDSLSQLNDASNLSQPLDRDKLQKFSEFLKNCDYTKFFCWIEVGTTELSWSFDRAPKFYGKYNNFILLV
jgi:hypothetical protein